ncbi:hypothetical protein [Streptomyces sp. NBC_01716]|uniref:hypothetical protein n=1 Tax=Streptomyces sp. NBC_01716 TaxID=2975917 RepID=UPI002E2F4C1C|nr:hypothetical protein [Streptomyces sp. NBC_01716]
MLQPAASPCPDAEIRYWYEHVTYRSLTAAGSDVETIERRSARTPAEAIRQIRQSVRALTTTLPPNERKRALSWAEGGGCVGAVAALHRGEPCGFSLSRRGAWVEWTVHPYHVFHTAEARRLPLVPTCPPLNATGAQQHSQKASRPS